MAGDESRYNEVPNRCSTRKRRVLNSIGLVLIIWDLLLAIPISYGLTILAYKTAGRYLNSNYLAEFILPSWKNEMEAILQNNFVTGKRALFVILNLGIILSWAVQLAEKGKDRAREETMIEILWWDEQIEHLESMLWELEEKELQEQIQWEHQQNHKPVESESVVGLQLGARKDQESAFRKKSRSRTTRAVSVSSKQSATSKKQAHRKMATLQVPTEHEILKQPD